MSYVAFDLEITKGIPKGEEDWKALRPLGISCAATLASDSDVATLWCGAEQEDGRLAAQMSPEECRELARYLMMKQGMGYPIVGWNSLGFDFDVLTEECRDEVLTATLQGTALCHIDIAFQMLCEKGFMCGLDAAAKGMGLAGKTEGMHGDLAPVMWAQGRKEQDKVLEYVAQDVRTTAEVYKAILDKGHLTWITRRGTKCVNPWVPEVHKFIGGGNKRLLTVREALGLPLPDTSWMDEPSWPRSRFYAWTGWEPEAKAELEQGAGGSDASIGALVTGLAQTRAREAELREQVADLEEQIAQSDLGQTLAMMRERLAVAVGETSIIPVDIESEETEKEVVEEELPF